MLKQPVSTLEPAEYDNFTVRFAPFGAGNQTASLVIASNDPESRQFVINRVGEGAGRMQRAVGGAVAAIET